MEFANHDEMLQYCSKSGRTYVSLALQQADREFGVPIELELFTDIAPSTCANFIKYVRGDGKLHYKGCPLHRVVKNGWVQGGDVVHGTGKGDPGFNLPDETFAVKHDEAGILGMANNGQPHTANTQFYITLHPLPFLDGKRVAFGRVLTKQGLEMLRSLQDLPLFQNERPVPDVYIREISVIFEP